MKKAFTEKQRIIIGAMEELVHNRFNKESLEDKLSSIFNEPIKVELGCEDVDYLGDWDYMFSCENDEFGGDFDVYVLMHKNKDIQGNTMYVTEVSYDFYH
jgi:hypothetical protein